jgi:hypothetical protein
VAPVVAGAPLSPETIIHASKTIFPCGSPTAAMISLKLYKVQI